MPVRYISTQLNGPWFDSRCWLCQQPQEATDGNGAKEANNINIANKAAEANDARKPTTPRRPTRGPWPRLACTEDSPLVRFAVLAQAEANDAQRLLMARRPSTPTWPWRPTTPRRPTRGPWLRLACTEDNPAVHPSIHYPLYAWQLSAPPPSGSSRVAPQARIW